MDSDFNLVGNFQPNKIKNLLISIAFIKKDSHFPNLRTFNVKQFGF